MSWFYWKMLIKKRKMIFLYKITWAISCSPACCDCDKGSDNNDRSRLFSDTVKHPRHLPHNVHLYCYDFLSWLRKVQNNSLTCSTTKGWSCVPVHSHILLSGFFCVCKLGDWPLSTGSILWTENKVIEKLRKRTHGKDLFLRCIFSMVYITFFFYTYMHVVITGKELPLTLFSSMWAAVLF